VVPFNASVSLACSFFRFEMPMGLTRRLKKLLRCDRPIPSRVPVPTRLRFALRPRIGSLEPRLVLNATAELNALGQLVISGGNTADTVHVEVNASEQLLLRDGNGMIIPISGHPGVTTAPLAISAITSSHLIIDLGGGDDVLRLQIPSSLSVTVMDGAGVDSTTLAFQSSLTPNSNRTIDVVSDWIRIDAGIGSVDLRNVDTRLTGNVVVGSSSAATSLQIEDASFAVDGLMTLDGDVSLIGSSSMINLANATLSATRANNNLTIAIGDDISSEVFLGEANETAGERVHNLTIDSAHSVSIQGSSFDVAGTFAINDVKSHVRIESDILAKRIEIASDAEVLVTGDFHTTDGDIRIASQSVLNMAATLDTSDSTNRAVSLEATSIRLHDVAIITNGGSASVRGHVLVDGLLRIDSTASASTVDAGSILIHGSIDSFNAGEAILNFNTHGAIQRGVIIITDSIGAQSTLHSATFRTASLSISDIRLGDGSLQVDALGTSALGSLSSINGSIDVNGLFVLQDSDLSIQANRVTLRGPVVGDTTSQSLTILATENAVFGDSVIEFANLNVTAGISVTFAGPVSLTGDMVVHGAIPTQVFSPTLLTLGKQVFDGGVNFLRSGSLTATEVSLDGSAQVAANIFFNINAIVVGDQLRKFGDGTLIFNGESRVTGETSIEAGALRINGFASSDTSVIRIANGRLEGNGLIVSEVIAVDRSFIDPGPRIGTLTIAELSLNGSTILGFQFDSIATDLGHDQIVINHPLGSTSIHLGSALLELTFDSFASTATEYVLIRNDGTEALSGNLTAAFDTNGTLISSARTLTEGSLVLQDFGGSGSPAYITYAGGDGNDVTIVTKGEVSIEAGNVTLIQREGSNLEIRTGDDFASAQAATPTIRPIASVNDHQIRINGSPTDQMLFVDLNDFVDGTTNAIEYTGEIFFTGGGPSDHDSITLLDLNPVNDDSPASVRYSLDSSNSGVIVVTTRDDTSEFSIRFAQVETIAQSLTAPSVTFQYSSLDEQIEVSQDTSSPERTLITSTTSSGAPLNISIENPTQSLTVLAGGGDDAMVVSSFGTGGGGFAAALTLDGQAGDDEISLLSELELGRDNVTGNLNVRAESISISGDVSTTRGTTDGQINLLGGTSIEVTRSAMLDSGTSSLFANAAGGSFDSSVGSLVSSSNTDAITISNASAVHLGNIDSATGRIRIETNSLTGNITQATGTRILTDRIVVNAIGSLDLSGGANDVQTIESIVASGAVSITDAINDLAVSMVDSRGSDVTIQAIGVVKLSAGAIIANAAVVNLSAGSAIIDNRVTGDNQVPNISAATINLVAGSAGIGDDEKPLVIEATNVLNANTGTLNGDVFLSSSITTMQIGFIDAGNAVVSLNSISIQDATNDSIEDIVAGKLRMTAQLGIGSVRELELRDVINLSASTASGGIRLDHASSDRLTITSLESENGPIEIRHRGSDLLSVERIESGDGNISITHQDGSINVVGDGTSFQAITAGANGAVSLIAIGTESDITLQTVIGSELGNITIAAERSIFLQSGGDIRSSDGDISLAADVRTGQFGGSIEMSDGATIETAMGTVSMISDGDIRLGGVATQNNSDNAIFIQSTSGSLVDGGDSDIDLIANSGGVILISENGIGDVNPLETSLGRLIANVIQSGAIQIHETDEIELRSLLTADGRIAVHSGGMIIATAVVSSNRNSIDDSPGPVGDSRDIQLTTRGMSSDILVGNLAAMNGADVWLIAGDDVFDINPADADQIVADDLSVTALNGLNDTTTAIRLTTNVNDLVFSVRGNNAGDVFFKEVDSITLASSDADNDSGTLSTSNGRIVIEAGDRIVIRDDDSSNDDESLRGDVEIIAGGDRGKISLTAGQEIQLAGATQFEASLAVQESIFVSAPSVMLGSQIQFYTGNGTGIARWFSSRPMPGLTDTAFFDYTTVATNRLTQSGANDAFGELSLLVGKQGENGFTMNIDWGDSNDPNYRFQQIDNLPGNESFVQRHIYLENDILNSTLNGRTSATAPLQVRFSVRHHESIVVKGDSIQQATTAEEFVEGRLLSSTDNPLASPLLENGTATFTIPNLTIPVAFFPIRQIVPETVEPELFVRVETAQFLATSTLETKTTSASSTISRDEYLQIRVLSLEPGGDDIAAPQRLPDDILSGDNLKKLFNELPDGRYEIQYVLGDGNERMLLRFDLRNHQPFVPGDELEGNQLKLKAIDPESILRELQDQVIEPQQLPEPAEASRARLDDAASWIDELENSKDLTNSFFGNAEALAAAGFVGTGLATRRRWRGAKAADIPNPWSFAGRFVNRNSKPR